MPGHALLQALLIHRLLPHGFTNRDLRALVAPLLGTPTEDITAGKMTYDLRRLRAHGLIARVPHSRRYQITDTGLAQALLFTHAHDHLLRTALAEITDPDPPAPSRLRAADRAYQRAFDDLAHYAHLAA
jgi:predicted MarR family transcription regulator